MKLKLGFLAAPILATVLTACTTDSTGRVTLALSSARPAGPSPSTTMSGGVASPSVVTAGDSTVISLGNDTIIVRSAELVLREVELKRVEAQECDNVEGNDDCDEFETGPFLVSLPLGTTATETVVSIDAAPGMYDELEFQIHKPEDDSSEDDAFLAANPTFARISIRVTGTYSQGGSRSDFTYESDLNAEQEILLSPPLTVSEGQPANVTLRIDISSWFLNGAGSALVNPATANKGQPNEQVVENRIQASIDAFRDDDHNGHDDDTEDHD
ncbi:MAG TPA: hypothetical protein VN803_11800 [Gemmatimonadales bacterium]|nr:hypothetical protein [Gemmatimonadales bacterium]